MSFTCQQIRDLVKTRGHYLMAGLDPGEAVVVGLTATRDEYLARVGLATYLSQMLDDVATMSMRHCVLGWPDGRVEMGNLLRPRQDRARPVQKYLREKYHQDLPYAVEVRLGVGHVVVRFL
jgi:hypothetical protein